jgi:hypothetical protein
MMPAGVGETPHIAQVLERDGLYVLPEFLSTDEIKSIAIDGLRLYEERPVNAISHVVTWLTRGMS